ncbi:MAG: recombinase family protein, partial [Clostridia bacterium]
GYDEVKGKLTPNGDAWIIARAFELFTSGMLIGQVAKILAAEGAQPLHGKGEITAKTVYTLLRNELYVGDRTLQKEAPHHYLTKRPDPTVSYKSHFIKDDHAGIISRDVWNRAREMIAKAEADKAMGVHRTCAEPHFLYGHVFCADCGAPFTRRTLRNRDGTHYKAWNCRERQKGRKGNGCTNTVVKEDELLRRIAEEMGMDQFDERVFRNEADKVLVRTDGIQLRTKETA